ncbi:MAG: DUF2550 domain-containing protein [Jatrophihabitans sp.]|uniref:DUF2550 domain-containing protein n=1 Tax=Jatrophihabitans sp. TaxID=1932789 RepID=UPI003F80DB29
MHTVDVIAVCVVALALIVLAAVLARQRYMLRLPGAIALAVLMPSRNGRWLYGMGRYVGGELRWYRALGFGSRPSQVLERGAVEVLRRRSPTPTELTSLPENVVVLECRGATGPFTMALSEGAYTGFVSWLESSAPI